MHTQRRTLVHNSKNGFLRIRKYVVFLATIAISMATSSAAVQTFVDEIPTSNTTWNNTIAFPQFDSSLGTLTEVRFELAGTVQGQASAESLDASASTVTLDLLSTITLSYPDPSLGVITTSLPVVSTTQAFLPFDGAIDFAGTSGSTSGLLTATDTANANLATAGDLALFTGTGFVTLPLTAVGNSSGSGAGNLTTLFDTDAGATVTVEYDFDPVPEPAALSLLGIAAILGLFCFRHRR